jgi:hypothetical protein
MLVNRKLKLAFDPIKSMIISIFPRGRSRGMAF